VAGCCECGDEPSGSGATELVQCSTEGYVSMVLRAVWRSCPLKVKLLPFLK
jgi:hypothetical protein